MARKGHKGHKVGHKRHKGGKKGHKGTHIVPSHMMGKSLHKRGGRKRHKGK